MNCRLNNPRHAGQSRTPENTYAARQTAKNNDGPAENHRGRVSHGALTGVDLTNDSEMSKYVGKRAYFLAKMLRKLMVALHHNIVE